MDAAQALHHVDHPSALEGLLELLQDSPLARPALAALAALATRDDPLVSEALVQVMRSSLHPSVRLAALEALQRRPDPPQDCFLDCIRSDQAWIVRRAAVRALEHCSASLRGELCMAASDPHWRVRHALIQVLLAWGEQEARCALDQLSPALRTEPRVHGVVAYLNQRWGHEPGPIPPPDDPASWCPFWDWDEAVLARTMEEFEDRERRQHVDLVPRLLAISEEKVHPVLISILQRWGKAEHFALVLTLLDDPRRGLRSVVERLFQSLDDDDTEAVARLVLHSSSATPAQRTWALDQVETIFPAREEEAILTALVENLVRVPVPVQGALARLLGRWRFPGAVSALRALLGEAQPLVQCAALRTLAQLGALEKDEATWLPLLRSPDERVRAEMVRILAGNASHREWLEPLRSDRATVVRVALAEELARCPDHPWLAALQQDRHSQVRAAAITPARAEVICHNPECESSWKVRSLAARLVRIPVWQLEPREPWQPTVPVHPEAPTFALETPLLVQPRLLGASQANVSALGISGHYLLPVEGFARAMEGGVNCFFWEPNYLTLNDFAGRISPRGRHALHFLAGTFEAEPRRIARDVERALRVLHIERLTVFLLFWVRSWRRVTPEVRATLEALKKQGKIGDHGLSTHARGLALEALEEGWNPIMVRHSAAHRGAEERIFPLARQRGVSLITFNNTCYGRLLVSQGGEAAPTPSDCYRYALSQPAVSLCLSAPATLAQLEENLRALHDPALPADRRDLLLRQGARVYAEDALFRRTVRAL